MTERSAICMLLGPLPGMIASIGIYSIYGIEKAMIMWWFVLLVLVCMRDADEQEEIANRNPFLEIAASMRAVAVTTSAAAAEFKRLGKAVRELEVAHTEFVEAYTSK